MIPDNKPVTILMLVTRLNIGGPAVQVATLAGALPASRFKTILAYGKLGSNEGDMGYLIDDMGVSKALYIPDLVREVAPLKDVKALIAISRLIAQLKPDIVHTHTAKAGTLGRAAVLFVNAICPTGKKIRVVHTFHGHTFHSYFGGVKTRFFILVEKLLSIFTDRIIAISPLQKEDISHKYGIASERKVSIVPLGFDLSRFGKPENRRNEFLKRWFPGSPRDVFLAGIVGRLTHVKNQRMFLEVAEVIKEMGREKDFRFVLVGDGDLKPDLMKESEKLGLEKIVRFIGWRKDVARIYPALDAVLLTSLNEGTPVSIIEALASEKPVIATDVGGVRDLMGKKIKSTADRFWVMENGILVQSKDADAMAFALIHLRDERDAFKKRAKKARQSVIKRYSTERVLDDMSALYLSLCRQ